MYGLCHSKDRRRFWEELVGLYSLCGENWCIGDDFNVVIFVYENSNRGRRPNNMRVFNNFVTDTDLQDPCLLKASFS